ncbi:MAG: phosphoribosylanthranilate isomerase [Pseudomonadota bacterium]
MASIQIKICGLVDPAGCAAAVAAGADYLGFNFFAKSPRYVPPADAAVMAAEVPRAVRKVGLVVDESNAFLDTLIAHVPLDIIQLHGSETPERVAEVKARTGLPVMKAVGLRDTSDLAALEGHAQVADQLLIDAKPPEGAVLPGGNGLAFDWSLIAGKSWSVPWMLAGGLTPANVAVAIEKTGTVQVDVSSGVESAPGIKDPELMRAFCIAARRATPAQIV